VVDIGSVVGVDIVVDIDSVVEEGIADPVVDIDPVVEEGIADPVVGNAARRQLEAPHSLQGVGLHKKACT
jgi:hypothetical protein